jgi:hypothetical protein
MHIDFILLLHLHPFHRLAVARPLVLLMALPTACLIIMPSTPASFLGHYLYHSSTKLLHASPRHPCLPHFSSHTIGHAGLPLLHACLISPLTQPAMQGYRYSMPHSILMMHHPSGVARGQASEIHIESRELVRMRDYLSLVVSDATGQPYDRVSGGRNKAGRHIFYFLLLFSNYIFQGMSTASHL